MVTFPLEQRRSRLRLPTRKELRAMLNDRAVVITAMILGFLLAIGLVGAVVILAWAGKDSSVVNTLVTGSLMGMAGAMAARYRAKGTKDDGAA